METLSARQPAVEAIVSYVGYQPMPGNPLVPMVQLSAEENAQQIRRRS